ncbi:MAG: biotin-dependent carboxyltransferase family protein [Sulfuriferula multivorans]|uniref:Biotin-dependent carboxyltransferase family protein n=1 Tax=Sulfuriferula multivorans TaxID=1559896 RepID=A0A7C9K7K9_9PROT|nr:biotin-dependent carboxyltransferase family protein [Sulfuriferula multivorans]
MMEVQSSGALNTIQDLGRYGYRKIGVSVAGTMDKLALAAGNLLLGNHPNSACIEITIFPFRVRFLTDTGIVVTGADCAAELDGASVLPWWATPVRSGQLLVLSAPTRGCRAYLTVRGGINVPVVLNSRSTDLKAKFGGHDGRSLRKGDRLAVLNASVPRGEWEAGYGVEPPHLALPFNPGSADGAVAVRVIPAAEYEKFPKYGQAQFWDSLWLITPNSNRQGYRLSGTALPTKGQSELLSHGIVPGTIQVPPSGQPIIQMSDANTSGGYPKMGTVIEADMWRLAQARLGENLKFVPVTVQDAIAALVAERAWLQKIETDLASLQGASADAGIK